MMALIATLCLLIVSGCGQDSPTQGSTTAPANSNFFGDTYFIGRTVTITGIVTRVITEQSFVLDTRDFGDESLLVLCEPSRDVAAGDRIHLSGNVQKFVYGAYAEQYGLSTDAAYKMFAGEEFLVTAQAMRAE
ncbi:hypothetical protein [Paractinoplanes abujensis]|uniref:Lipoprotein n=1 Tax=Paractinoplanes abujensis TaxID=882441 RepID=A0A7W7G2W9_9ACTN|nr:hypothetical protein [Actinoplanes abujensis]MBB4693550.1 hypothetical protein [Actinoplanes abujensis]